ncbi:MAG: hypothetical protein ABH967_00800 [Patescibacteria group bacterium]
MNNKQSSQKSLLWIISTLWLTTAFAGKFLGSYVAIIGMLFIPFNPLLMLFLSSLIAYLIGLKTAIDYVFKKTDIEETEIKKIVISFVLIPIVGFLFSILSSEFQLKTFSLNLLLTAISSAILFFFAHRWLNQKAISSLPVPRKRFYKHELIILILIFGFIVTLLFIGERASPESQQTTEELEETLRGKIITSIPGKAEIGATSEFVIYKKSEWIGDIENLYMLKNYRIFKLDLQTEKETELKLLNYSFDVNADFYLSPNGKYIARTLYSKGPMKLELLSLNNTEELITLVEEDEDVSITMLWSDDSSKIAYWTVSHESPSWSFTEVFKIYLIDMNKTPITSSLIKVYDDMHIQGAIKLEKFISSERKLYLKRTKIANGAPPVWEGEIISF